MKFRFCGEGDCPDWVLAEIISTLSNFTAAKLETLALLVCQRIKGLPFEEDKVKAIAGDIADDGKSAVACLDFILVNSARYNIEEIVLLEELQQLGLPKFHANGICRVLTENHVAIRKRLLQNSFKINELEKVEYKLSNDVYDAVLLELKIGNEIIDGLPKDETHVVSIDRANLFALLKDMKEARNIVSKYNSHSVSGVNS